MIYHVSRASTVSRGLGTRWGQYGGHAFVFVAFTDAFGSGGLSRGHPICCCIISRRVARLFWGYGSGMRKMGKMGKMGKMTGTLEVASPEITARMWVLVRVAVRVQVAISEVVVVVVVPG